MMVILFALPIRAPFIFDGFLHIYDDYIAAMNAKNDWNDVDCMNKLMDSFSLIIVDKE